jgi:8-oxo-dGTP pyrophosphatase MutT (NUDIX family)
MNLETLKNAYLSPATGGLSITVVRDARPYAVITLDLGIPNFTVFSLKFPLVEDKPSTMSELVAEAVHALLDEMSAFMLSLNFEESIIVKIYAAALMCFKGITGESDSDKALSAISKDPTVKVFEGTFRIDPHFVNEVYSKVVTASGKTIKRPPVQRHLELTYEKPSKTTVNDARSVIRNFRSRSLKSQPNPMYIIVYDMMGNPRGTIPLSGTGFKNNLLNAIYKKKGSRVPEFTPTIKFDNDVEMKTTNAEGIPKSIFVGDEAYSPYATIGDDMAIYSNSKKEWVVKFPDGRCVTFADFPSVAELKEGNYPVPTIYTNWSILSKENVPESSDKAEAVDEQGNEVIEPSETESNPETDLKPDDEKNEQQQDKEKTSSKRAFREDEKGYWVGAGGAASGILPICTTTGRICLAWRSPEVNQGDCFGTIGGAIQPGMSPAESAKEEMAEETGYQGSIRLVPAYVFTDGKFKYFNFLGLVPTEFELNPMAGGSSNLQFHEETDGLVWVTWEELQKNVVKNSGNYHNGVIKLLQQSGDQIRQICEAASNNTKEAAAVDAYLRSKEGQPYTHRYRGLPIAYIPAGEGEHRGVPSRRMVHLFTRNGDYAETFNSLAELKDNIDSNPDGWGADSINNMRYRITRVSPTKEG